jgi:hypothetical protein
MPVAAGHDTAAQVRQADELTIRQKNVVPARDR